MYVRVRTVDGKEEKLILISKTATVKDLKHEIEKELHVEDDLQRLFFGGKQLDDCYTIYDYNIKLNDVIQLLKKTRTNTENEATSSKSMEKQKKKSKLQKKSVEKQVIKEQLLKEQENIEEKAKSLYYKVNDAVDCLDKEHGVWFEAIIQEIVKEEGEILYNVLWEFDNEAIPFNVPETHIRPRARRQVSFSQLSIGQKVMINYNIEEPEEDIGLWYDFTITAIKQNGKLKGIFHVGIDRQLEMDNVIPKGQIYEIEVPKLLTERTMKDETFMISNGKRRPIVPACQHCMDNPRRKCLECGCKVCGGKNNEDRILICDECQYGHHLECLQPPLLMVPEEDEWFCPDCKNDETEIVKPGDKLKMPKKRSIIQEGEKKTKRDWGNGMACVGATKTCTIVPKTHRGPIPGIEVGTSWYYRFQVLETGVHRSQIGGIHGRVNDCAYSIVVSGLYDESDYDNGDEFQYTGSGGRDLSGNKRTAKQSMDQQLTRLNKALALNCNAPFNNKTGATAEDWKSGIPIRVVRSSKAGNKYAPEQGYRYDGIYKVVKYFPKKNKDGFIMWKYLIRRDDPVPAPWTSEGKERIASLGLELEYPEGYKTKTNISKTSEPPLKKLKKIYDLEEELKHLINNDNQNAKAWADCMAALSDGKLAFQKCVLERFKCSCCLDIVYQPITLPCAHNICLTCLMQAFSSHELYSCPTCRHHLGKDYKVLVNEQLRAILLQIYPGYESGRR